MLQANYNLYRAQQRQPKGTAVPVLLLRCYVAAQGESRGGPAEETSARQKQRQFLAIALLLRTKARILCFSTLVL